jgi:nitroreductase
VDAELLLTTTRSVRRTFDLDAPVDRDDIRDCLGIALQAANGTNQQTWHWLTIFDAQLRRDIAAIYRDAYLQRVGGQLVAEFMPAGTPESRLMSSTEWLVEHMAEVPLLVIPCFEPYLPRTEGDEAFFLATTYGSIFPAVWNFQLALHDRGYGSCMTTLHLFREAKIHELLGIPDSYLQSCLLPVGRLPNGKTFKPAARRPVEDVATVDRWDGATI